ncbi:MAG: transcription factor WhiB [Propionibacteriales bacterium]|nr:transcription factor WhiB [Propionibacteriales bacterium]
MQPARPAEARASSAADQSATPCSVHFDLYLHPLLEEPPTRSAVDAATWQQYQTLVSRARGHCAGCPLLVDCLYKAVVQTDISGYVGCTTPKERQQIRTKLGVKLDAENFDTAAGTRGARRPVDHDDVLRARAAYPDDSLEMLANRLGCSLSTVKRHMRRARQKGAAPSPKKAAPAPTVDSVFEAFDEVVEVRRGRTAS